MRGAEEARAADLPKLAADGAEQVVAPHGEQLTPLHAHVAVRLGEAGGQSMMQADIPEEGDRKSVV